MGEESFNPGDNPAETQPLNQGYIQEGFGYTPVTVVGAKMKDGQPHLILDDDRLIPEGEFFKDIPGKAQPTPESTTDTPESETSDQEAINQNDIEDTTQPELSAEEQQARKAVIDYLTPRIKAIQDRKDNPRPGDGFQLAKLEALLEGADEGKFIEQINYSGINAEGKTQKGKNSPLKYFLSTLEHSQQGTRAHSRVANVLKALKEAGVDIPEIKPEDNGPNVNDEPAPKKESQPKNSGDGGKKETNKDTYKSPESPWLDPRRIQELKVKFEQKYAFLLDEEKKRLERMQDDTPISPHFRDIVKTHVIESEINKTFDHAKRIWDKYNIGEAPEIPSKEIKQQMAALLDESWDEVNSKAEQIEKEFADKHQAFKKGQRVNLVKRDKDRTIDEGWVVDKITFNGNGEEWVWISKGRDRRHVKADYLMAQQEEAPVDEMEKLLKRMRPYFGKEVKIKAGEDQVIKGLFTGVSMDGKAFLDYKVYKTRDDGEVETDKNGKPIIETIKMKVSPDDFFEWQKLKTQEEVEKDKQAKLESINAEIPDDQREFQLDQEVKVIRAGEDSGGKERLESGWIVDYFKKQPNPRDPDTQDIIVGLLKDGEQIWVEQGLLQNMQSAPEDYKTSDERNAEADTQEQEAETEEQEATTEEQQATAEEERRVPATLAERMGNEDLSVWSKIKKRNEEYWKKFDPKEGDSPEEINRKKRKKRAAKTLRGLVGAATFWNVGVWAAVVAGPPLIAQHKTHKWRKELRKVKRDHPELKRRDRAKYWFGIDDKVQS